MDSRTSLSFVLLAIALVSGCASARHVMKDAETGIVAIPANSQRNREKAISLMEQHFPEGYVIEREEEIVVGQTTHQEIDGGTNDGKHRIGQTRSTATTVPTTEYRISYRKR